MAGFVFFTQIWDCSVDTELINRNNCAKNSCNRFLVGTIVDRQFSTTFALEHSSGQWTRGTENWVSAFSKFYHHQLRDSVPFSLLSAIMSRIPLLFWSRVRRMTIYLVEIFMHKIATSLALDSHSCLIFWTRTSWHGEASNVSQQGQHGHVRDAEGRSAGLLLTPNISQCQKKENKEKARTKKVQQLNQKTLHVGTAVSYCAVRHFDRPDQRTVSTCSAP